MKKTGLFVLTILCFMSLGAVYSESVQGDLSENLLRMHIIANSNSEYDQKIKLLVRDEITSGNEFPDAERINETAMRTLEKYGAEYGVKTEYVDCFVPEKEYKNICLPEGEYSCIRVVLGEGLGENWWCIAYPPLCFSEAAAGELSESARTLLEGRLDAESLRAVIKNGDVNMRFWVVEEFQRIKSKIAR